MVKQSAANVKEQDSQQADEVTKAVNVKYKDTIFRMLFSDKKNLLSFVQMPLKAEGITATRICWKL